MLSVGAFALDVSVGFQVSAGFFYNSMTTFNGSLAVSSELWNTSLPFHAEGYLDMQYFQLGVGYRIRVLGHQTQTTTVSGSTTTLTNADTGTKGYATISGYLKYPFTVGQYILLPLLGFEYDVNALNLDANGNDLRGSMTAQQRDNENQFWLKFGMGAQLDMAPWGYLRARFLVGWKLPNQAESDAVANARSSPGWDATLRTLEPEIGFAVGFNM